MNEFEDITDNTAFVINLEHRVDRWYQITENCGHLLDLRRVNAVRESPGWIGCYKSHIKILQEADNLNLDTVLVLEDDCMISNVEQFENRWCQIKQWLDTNLDKWDIFLGGNMRHFDNAHLPRIINRDLNLVQLSLTYGTHFTYYNKSTYHHILNQPMINPIDWFSEHFCVVVPCPYLAVQRPGFSDIVQRDTPWGNLFADTENQLRDYISSH